MNSVARASSSPDNKWEKKAGKTDEDTKLRKHGLWKTIHNLVKVEIYPSFKNLETFGWSLK